ncbi:SufB/SufD family protein [Limosilactobacillus secaliphilus]|uniref:FeS assembly protein SufD n=1 Tax=Limosilactobacillus secaliphilus TaxID=396268 RepID=A0A0R2ICC8_9LACO|nr:SufD family Fe-S cluster assembly protein [Limosilactobacillus secaliphilus]KRN59213.1 FeS assembly protein SufD [Limosilactobacillus secaliphilus]
MPTDLVSQIKAAAHNQPAWLQKKRQLAAQLAANFPDNAFEQAILDHWQSVDLTEADDGQGDCSTNDYVDLPLFTASAKYSELLQENLMEKAISWQDSRLNALHMALLNGGRFVYVPDGKVVKDPIELKVTCQQSNYHNLVIVGANAQVTIVEQQTGASPVPTFFGTELLLGDGAVVNYYQSNHFTAQNNWQATRAYQAADSQLNVYTAFFDGHDLYTDTFTSLDGDGSQADVKTVAISNGHQRSEVHTRIDNHGLHTNGMIQQNGVALDHGVLNFHAVGKIYHGSHQSNSNQESRLLTLNKASRGETDPVLLIEDNDVDAGHAASIGKVDADQLYYLQSRGLTLQQAQILLTKGFLLPVINKFPDSALRARTQKELLDRLEVAE